MAQTTPVYDGRSRHTDVPIPRVETGIRVDGLLDDAAWGEAARLSGFSQYRPADGRPASDSTEVLVFYSPTAIHFGIRAWESHGNVVRATLADRDNIGADDRVQILLDTYDDDRRALLFSVNPLGVQQDGVQSEGFDPSQSAGGRFDGVVDISPDFTFESRGHVTAWGYEAEVRIPFKSLRYQQGDPQRWGLQIIRFTQHSGHEDTWTPAVRASASFLVQSGHLTGLSGLRRGTVVDIDPEFTSSVAGAPGPNSWRYGRAESQLGGNLRWGVTSNLTVNATVNPDFSQVETDVSQVTVNERFALFFPEKRPFFLDGLEQYDTPNRLIYTRQIRDPVAGVKLTGKVGGTAIAYLGALFILLLNAFWEKDAFTGRVEPFAWSLAAFGDLIANDVYRTITARTLGMAVLVTLTDALLAFPVAYYMARIASPRTRNLLVIAVLMPLWAAYLVKVYSWRTILQGNGLVEWMLTPFGISGPGLDELANTWLVLSYLWLPYMILPIYAGLERIPTSLLEASADLGAGAATPSRRVILPLVFPVKCLEDSYWVFLRAMLVLA